jgi:hypothetical protein
MPEGCANGYADGGAVSDSSNDSDAATTTDLHISRSSAVNHTSSGAGQGLCSSGTPYRVGRRASAGADLSTLSSSWRASDCMPFGGGGGGNPGGSPHRGSLGGSAVRMSLEGVSTSDGRFATLLLWCSLQQRMQCAYVTVRLLQHQVPCHSLSTDVLMLTSFLPLPLCSDTTQMPPAPHGAPPLALQGRLISAPPCLPPGPATGSALQVTGVTHTCIPDSASASVLWTHAPA